MIFFQAGFVASFRYAAEGSRKPGEWWIPVAGGFLGFLVLKLWGLETLFSGFLPSDPLAQNACVIVVCVALGIALVFLTRLAYSPMHFLVKRYGGYGSLWRGGLSMPLLPAILMAAALFLFVTLFAAGGILYVIQNNVRPQGTSQIHTAEAGTLLLIPQLSVEDKEYRRDFKKFVLSDCQAIVEKFGALLHEMAVANGVKAEPNRALAYVVDMVAVPQFYQHWSDLYNYANQDTTNINIEIMMKLTNDFLNNYSSFQRMYMVLIGTWDPTARNPRFQQEWIDVDKNVLYALRNLRASNSKYLQAQDSVMFAGRP